MRIILAVLSCLITASIVELPALAQSADSLPAVRSVELDANAIRMHVSNNGAFARDEQYENGVVDGLVYPKELGVTLVYSAGLWLAARQYPLVDTAHQFGHLSPSAENGDGKSVYPDQKIALSEFVTEYAPGPFGHAAVEDSSIFRPYAISRIDTDSTAERIGWPVEWGAPVDDGGNPLLTGDQSVWTVFNDGDNSRHDRRGGGTSPLNAEIQLYAYSYADAGLLSNAVFLEYTIVNKSGADWLNFIAGIWFDPDIGFYSDDFGGSDSALSFAYGYTLADDSDLPDDFEPSVGIVLLESPSVHTTDHPSGAANVFRNVYRSQSPDMTLNMLQGRDLDGEDYVNPTTGLPTKYRFSGDPRTGTGWLDDIGKGDRKVLIASSPVTISAGDTARIAVAVVAAVDSSTFGSLDKLFRYAKTARDFYDFGVDGITVSRSLSPGAIQSVGFDPPAQQWITGVDWGGSAFDGGVGWAGELWGSSLVRSDNVDMEIVFEPDSGHQAIGFHENDGSYVFDRMIDIPIVCRRTGDDRETNLILIDRDKSGNWSLYSSTSGLTDILLITSSTNDETPLSTYADRVFPQDALITDLMYAVSVRGISGSERRGMIPGQRLEISVHAPLESYRDGAVDFGTVVAGRSSRLPISISSRYRYPKTVELFMDTPDIFGRVLDVHSLSAGTSVGSWLSFAPTDTIQYGTVVYSVISEFGMGGPSATLVGRGGVWPLDGDLSPDGFLDIRDLAYFIRLLYGTPVETAEYVETDLDSSGETTIDDLVILFNRIFQRNF